MFCVRLSIQCRLFVMYALFSPCFVWVGLVGWLLFDKSVRHPLPRTLCVYLEPSPCQRVLPCHKLMTSYLRMYSLRTKGFSLTNHHQFELLEQCLSLSPVFHISECNHLFCFRYCLPETTSNPLQQVANKLLRFQTIYK